MGRVLACDGSIDRFSEGEPIRALGIFLFAGQLGTLLEQTGWVARVVLLMLLAFSLFSWALIFQKSRMFSRMNQQTALFLRIFRSNKFLPEPKQMGSGGSPHGKVTSLNAVTVSMQIAAAEEVRKAEKYMPWLATTGSVTPFIGLFGTVWGVMDAFTGLGAVGAASLRAVAPGIAEALITTAAGLFTAIPAVIAYNHFLHNIKDLGGRMDGFTLEVAATIEKLYPGQRM